LNIEDALSEPEMGPVWPRLGVHVVFLSVSRKDEIFVRVVLECHEGMGVARAQDPCFSEERTLLSLLVVPDFANDVRAMLADLASSADIVFYAALPEWIAQVERELP
jgi:hypothetical protein